MKRFINQNKNKTEYENYSYNIENVYTYLTIIQTLTIFYRIIFKLQSDSHILL